MTRVRWRVVFPVDVNRLYASDAPCKEARANALENGHGLGGARENSQLHHQRTRLLPHRLDYRANPLIYVDPDGKDAIAVNCVNEVPFGGGHEGIIVVHADGSATYARFGPQHASNPADQGKVDVQQLSPVTFREDGLPAVESYKQLSDEVAKIEGEASSTVGLNYFKTSEADSIALDNWMQQMKEASDKGRAPNYQVNSQNCATFCIAGLLNTHAVQNKGLSIIPNRLYMILAGLSAENYANGQRSKPKEKMIVKIVGCRDMHGNPCTQ